MFISGVQNGIGWLKMVTTTISNSGGTLTMNAIIDWREKQVFDVAIREVAKRDAGAVVDDSTFSINPKIITIKTRLSSAEKTTLQAIIDAVELATFIGGSWSYTVWIKTRQPRYKYVVNDGTLRPWETSISMVASVGGLCPSGEQLSNRGFETGDFTGWTEDGTSSVTMTQKHTGVYSARISKHPCTGVAGWIRQTISINVGCVSELTFWAKYGTFSSTIRMTVHYDDGTEDTHDFAITSCGLNAICYRFSQLEKR